MSTPFPNAPAEECQGLVASVEPAGGLCRVAKAKQVSAVAVAAMLAGALLFQFSGVGVGGAATIPKRATGALLAREEVKAPGLASLTKRDMYRAKKVIPGPDFQAAHEGESNTVLNRHLTRIAEGKVKPCEDFTLEQLEQLQRELTQKKHPELQDIHSTNRHPTKGEGWTDPRAGEGGEVDGRVLELLPVEVARSAKAEKACYDIAMHFTHSLADADKRELLGAGQHVPLLPARSANETDAHLKSQSPRALADAAAGESVFRAYCEACHTGGGNIILPLATLTRADLEKQVMYSAEKIVTQVKDGKNAMPAFEGELKPEQMENVAAYVLDQATTGW